MERLTYHARRRLDRGSESLIEPSIRETRAFRATLRVLDRFIGRRDERRMFRQLSRRPPSRANFQTNPTCLRTLGALLLAFSITLFHRIRDEARKELRRSFRKDISFRSSRLPPPSLVSTSSHILLSISHSNLELVFLEYREKRISEAGRVDPDIRV